MSGCNYIALHNCNQYLTPACNQIPRLGTTSAPIGSTSRSINTISSSTIIMMMVIGMPSSSAL